MAKINNDILNKKKKEEKGNKVIKWCGKRILYRL